MNDPIFKAVPGAIIGMSLSDPLTGDKLAWLKLEPCSTNETAIAVKGSSLQYAPDQVKAMTAMELKDALTDVVTRYSHTWVRI
jgi:hypothetical protein